jgi:hypothetical protein
MDYDLALLYNTTERRINFGPIEVRGSGMFWRVVMLLAATFTLFGCSSAREGVDFASLSRTVGPPKSGQGRIVILREQGYGGITDHGFPVGRASPAFSERVGFPGRDPPGDFGGLRTHLFFTGQVERAEQGPDGRLGVRRAGRIGCDRNGVLR